jgi:long-subunit acyl-CoA synthetase (AMP-forming)
MLKRDSARATPTRLPLAHILEFMVETQYLLWNPYGLRNQAAKTLIDKSESECRGDLTELKPTFLAVCPCLGKDPEFCSS